MKSILKKSAAVVVILCLLLSVISINVFAAGSSIAFSKNTVTIGETLTVTARYSTSTGNPMYGIEGFLTYDPNVVQFVSGDGANLLTDGKVKLVLLSEGKVNVTQTLKFKTKAAGKSAIALEQLIYIDSEDREQSLSGASATVTVTNPSAQASSNADLRKLGVSAGVLTPAFSPDVTSYNVTIPYGETELWVQPGLADQKASYVVEGGKDMKVGYNKRVIIVTAENGKTKSYTVNVTRLDENGQAPSTDIEDPVNDMVEVIADGETMYVNENFSTDDIPAGFEIIDYAIDGKNVPALSDESIILLNLIKPDGSESAFYVRNSDDTYTRLTLLEVGGAVYCILPVTNLPEGYTETSITVGESNVTAYSSSDPDENEFVLIYAKGPAGNTGFYRYDTVEATIQRAPLGLTAVPEKDDEKKEETSGNIIESFSKLNTKGKIVALTFLAVMILLLIVIIILIAKLISAIASGSKERKLKKLEEEAEDQVGFDYVSIGETTEPKTQTIEDITIEEETAETPVEEETAEDDEKKTEE